MERRFRAATKGSGIFEFFRNLLEVELQSELHGTGIGLHVSDLAELATELVNQVGGPIRIRRQTPLRVGYPEILVVESVVNIPPETEVANLSFLSLRRPAALLCRSHRSELPAPAAPQHLS